MKFNKYFLVVFLVGFCGLGSETLYFKILDFAVGSAPLVAFTVVAGFVLGMGLGGLVSAKVKHPSRIEAFLAVYHGAWALYLPQILNINAKTLALLSPFIGINVSSSLIGFLYIILPAFLLGVTFPIIVERTGRAGTPYLTHAFGALIGILMVEFWLYPEWGMPSTLFILGVFHLFNAFLLLDVSSDLKPLRIGRLHGFLIVVGAVTGSVQGIWLWFAELLFKPYFFIQPTVVAYFLMGLTVGSLIWVKWPFSFRSNLMFCAVGVLISALVGTFWLAMPFVESRPWVFLELGLILLPTAIPIGALFPAFMQDIAKTRAQAGAVILSMSIGNTVGLLFTGAILLRLLLPTQALLLIAVGLFLIIQKKSKWQYGMLAPLALLGVAIVVFGEQDFFQRIHPKHDVVAVHQVFRGPAEMSAVYAYAKRKRNSPTRHRRLYQNGYSPINLDRKIDSVISAVGMSYCHSDDRALVIGTGSGRSAGTVARVFDKVDVVDIGSTVKQLMQYLADDNWHILTRKGVRFHRMDGISAPYVFEQSAYDLIVMTVDPGYLQKAAKLYYVENLRALKGLLKPGGVLVFWADGKVGNLGAQALVNNGNALFKHQKLYSVFRKKKKRTPGYFLLIHSDEPLKRDYDRLGLREKLTGDKIVARHFDIEESDRLITKRYHPTGRLHSLYRPSLNVLLRRKRE
jgi:spermidine synthase